MDTPLLLPLGKAGRAESWPPDGRDVNPTFLSREGTASVGPDGPTPTFTWAVLRFRERKEPFPHVLVPFGVRLCSPKPRNPTFPPGLPSNGGGENVEIVRVFEGPSQIPTSLRGWGNRIG